MPFSTGIELLEKIINLIDKNIKENEKLKKSIVTENEIFYLNLKKLIKI